MRIIKNCFIVLLISLTIIVPTVNTYITAAEPDNGFTLSIAPIKQAKSNWCWAACSEMMGKALTENANRDQWAIVKYISGNECDFYPNTSASPNETIAGCKYACYNTKNFSFEQNTFTWNQIKDYIDSGKPLIGITFVYNYGTNKGGHSTLITGYHIENSAPAKKYIYYIDPATKARHHVPYYDYCNVNSDEEYDLKYFYTIYPN